MRKLEKLCTLSTVYKAWVDSFESSNSDHDNYNSSSNQFYWDVVMNLFYCQNGLCAYTESFLCPPDLYDENKWTDEGRYNLSSGKPQVKGQLEHFDRLKKTKKGWLWENFFMANTDVNTKVKLVSAVPATLKPDREGYDEFTLLDYDVEKNIFLPNPGLSEAEQIIIRNDLLILGINWGPIIEERRVFLKDKIMQIVFGIYEWNNIDIEQFPTAMEFSRRKMQA
jgi:hypothetical protein